MPLPEPKKNEPEDKYIARCMRFLDKEKSKLPRERRLAACYDAYRRSKKDENERESRLGACEVADNSNAVWGEGQLHWNVRSHSGRGSESVIHYPSLDDPIPDDKADLKQP